MTLPKSSLFLAAVLFSFSLHGQTKTTFETPPVFTASSHIPAKLLRGPHHRVREAAPSDGYMAHYTIDSDFGVFHCVGRRELRLRVIEIGAIAKLVAVSKSDLFAEGLKRSVEKPIDAVKHIVKEPGESIKQVPKTVGHFFSKVGSSIGNAAKKTEERMKGGAAEQDGAGEALAETGRGLGEAAKSVAGFDKAKLETARQLGVDPYSDNKRLQQEMEKVTWAFFAGGLPLRIGAAMVSGGASTALAATNTVGLPEEIYDITPGELALRDRRSLEAMKVPEDLIDKVFLNEVLTVSLRHEIVSALQFLPAGPGQREVVEVAVSCELSQQAAFLREALRILVSRHQESPYRALTTCGRLPAGVTAAGVTEVAAPVDYVSWTAEIAAFVTREDAPEKPRRLLLGGNVSPTAQAQIEKAGWETASSSGQ